MLSPKDDKTSLQQLFRDNPEAIAAYLTEIFAENELQPILVALNRVLRAQNVQALAREAGMRREKLYTTFGGEVDPQLSRLIKLLRALNLRLAVVPLPPRPVPPRPKLGRPRKEA